MGNVQEQRSDLRQAFIPAPSRLPLPQVLFPSGPQSGVSLLIDKYVQRTAGTLSSWLLNIVEVSEWWGRGAASLAALLQLIATGHKPAPHLPLPAQLHPVLLSSTPPPHSNQGDFKYEPKASAEGRMWTPGAVDFFRILNEQARRGGDGVAGYCPMSCRRRHYCH